MAIPRFNQMTRMTYVRTQYLASSFEFDLSQGNYGECDSLMILATFKLYVTGAGYNNMKGIVLNDDTTQTNYSWCTQYVTISGGATGGSNGIGYNNCYGGIAMGGIAYNSSSTGNYYTNQQNNGDFSVYEIHFPKFNENKTAHNMWARGTSGVGYTSSTPYQQTGIMTYVPSSSTAITKIKFDATQNGSNYFYTGTSFAVFAYNMAEAT